MRSFDETITLSDKEERIKTYHATTLRSSLGFLNRQSSEGFVTVTNKRVILHAHGDSFSGGSFLVSEVPVQNVSGLNSYMGKSTSLLWAIITLVLGLGCVTQILAMFASFAANSNSGSSGYNPYLSLGQQAPSPSPSFNFGALVLAAIFGGLAFLAFKKVFNTVFTLQVYANGADAAPIALGGATGGLFSQAASKALTASPAEDSELLIRELGAIVLELQTMGDMAIKRWKVKNSDEESSREHTQRPKKRILD